jgi:hypothetical protein
MSVSCHCTGQTGLQTQQVFLCNMAAAVSGNLLLLFSADTLLSSGRHAAAVEAVGDDLLLGKKRVVRCSASLIVLLVWVPDLQGVLSAAAAAAVAAAAVAAAAAAAGAGCGHDVVREQPYWGSAAEGS